MKRTQKPRGAKPGVVYRRRDGSDMRHGHHDGRLWSSYGDSDGAQDEDLIPFDAEVWEEASDETLRKEREARGRQ